jgi:hypothetical protein
VTEAIAFPGQSLIRAESAGVARKSQDDELETRTAAKKI